MNNLCKKCLAEFIGTFVLVFFACGVAAITGDLVATAFAFGLVIVAMAYTIGRISGCHINPAVSIAFLVKKKMTLKEFFAYVGAQVLGGLAGALLLFGIIRMNTGYMVTAEGLVGTACNHTATGELKAGPIFAALIFEVVLTCVFVFVILHVTDEKSEKVSGKLAGLIIGLTLTLVHLLGIVLTGTSVNPARSLATAISAAIYWSGDASLEPLKHVFIFIIAPLAGGVLAALLHSFLTKVDCEKKEEVKEEKEIDTDSE